VQRQHFTKERPNQVWVSDITYFKINHSRVYLCAIIDLFSRRVVGYRISHSANTRIVTTTFRKAYAEHGNPAELTFHSDMVANIFLIHFRNFCKIATSSNLFQRAAAHMTMQQRKPSLQRSKRKKHIDGNTLQNDTSKSV
jgi:transposase InsO family protein